MQERRIKIEEILQSLGLLQDYTGYELPAFLPEFPIHQLFPKKCPRVHISY
jgi:hypothetical protein